LPVPLSEIAVDAYLNKPCRRSVLLDCIVDLCGIRSDVDNDELPTAIPLETIPTLERSLRILVAEDNQVNQLLATRTLEKEGHRVDVANNGIEAVNAVQKFPYDIVLMDVNMPEMDGLQATAQIRALDGTKGQLPIIALTAYAMKGDRERLIGAGMNDYVSKPLDRGKLMAVIAEWAPAPAEPDFEMDEDLADDPAPAVTPVDDEPVLDSKVMEDWQTFFSEDDFCELVTTQSSDVHECLEKLKDAAANRQMDEFERLAHSLKSSCGSLGMGRVSKIAKHIELACRDSRPRMPSINCRTWSWKSTRRWRFSWSSTPNT